MSAKAKLRLRHIEDAALSSAVDSPPKVRAVNNTASPKTASGIKLSAPFEHSSSPQANPGSAVGETLRRHRTEQNFSLRDIADQLRIQRSYLEALETGDFDRLPGLTYAIGYVRSYARLLDLDPEALILDFKTEAKKLQEPTQLSFPSPAPEGKVPGGALVFVGVLLAALSYGGWYYFSTSGTMVSDLTPTVPDRLAFLLEEPAIGSTAPAGNAAIASEQVAQNAETPIPSAGETSSTGNKASKPVQTAATDAPIAPTPESVRPAPVTPVVSPPPADVIATAATTEPVTAAPEDLVPTSTDNPTPDAGPSTETVAIEEPIPEAPAASPISTSASGAVVPVPAPKAPAAAEPEQVASAPASDTGSEATAIPDIPEMPREASASTGRSGAEAEAAAIDSKPKPVSAVSHTGPIIVISATDDSWVQVRSKEATPLLTRILRKGERYEVPVRSGLKLFTGNAGALKISVNGAEAPSLGPFGKIARNIPLDESLLTHTVTD